MKLNLISASCALIATLWISGAGAQQQPYDFELTPFGAYSMGGEFNEAEGDVSIELDDSSSFGLIFNAKHSPNTQWEIFYSHQDTQASTAGLDISDSQLDLGIDVLQAGGTYLWDGQSVQPYLAATVGVTRIDVSNEGFDSDSFFSFGIGLGMQIRPTERIGIRLEARGLGTLLDSDSDMFCRSGPDENLCAIRIDGTVMWQLQTFAGLVFRF